MIQLSNHAFKGLDGALQQLHALLYDMGNGSEQLLRLLPEALAVADAQWFVRAKEIDKTVNETELKVDALVASIINKYSVMGEELRFALAAVKIAGTLERTADKLKNCIKRLGKVGHPMGAEVKRELASATQALAQMVPLSLAQILEYSPERTEQLLTHGAVVQQSYRAILLHLHAHQSSADDETHLLLVAKNLDQAADMAIEIMKTCHFLHFNTKFDKRSVQA
jgi:phosphate uptake regulator